MFVHPSVHLSVCPAFYSFTYLPEMAIMNDVKGYDHKKSLLLHLGLCYSSPHVKGDFQMYKLNENPFGFCAYFTAIENAFA